MTKTWVEESPSQIENNTESKGARNKPHANQLSHRKKAHVQLLHTISFLSSDLENNFHHRSHISRCLSLHTAYSSILRFLFPNAVFQTPISHSHLFLFHFPLMNPSFGSDLRGSSNFMCHSRHHSFVTVVTIHLSDAQHGISRLLEDFRLVIEERQIDEKVLNGR